MTRSLQWILAAFAVTIGMLAIATLYAAYVTSQNHKQGCNSRTVMVNAVEQLVQLAVTPQPGQTYTQEQINAGLKFQANANALLDKARC